jgi:NAD dependent epimerase/dehydratase family enzyme
MHPEAVRWKDDSRSLGRDRINSSRGRPVTGREETGSGDAVINLAGTRTSLQYCVPERGRALILASRYRATSRRRSLIRDRRRCA